ncbi:YkoF family thiamine/hydroxymethylpyrimidine-binding protein [Actinomyces radicidentis]|uniref:YkoF family thiamine/hydroxymethylpyrimidine-binding protein n=1 Tax=Actinomyces radicidentis TaxID=111015 RepID=UPI0026E067B8|nr:YkoF family thiamine/hydroxymethylpyrimidine-binding protein [Actinomyces radicidentis]
MPSTPRTTPAVGTSTDPTAPATSPDDERLALQRDPLRFGVGARVTLAVMADDYVDVILGALAGLDTTGLVTQTGDVSTYVGGSEDDVQRWVTDLADAVARTGRHASLTLTLSRGCPGEVACELPGGAGPRIVPVALPRRTGTRASAEWALYPLADAPAPGTGTGPGRAPDHMRDIHAAIDHARDLGTYAGSEHFVTRLEGDLGAVIATAFAGWTLVGRHVQHVTTHLTVSINSPSHSGRSTDGAGAANQPEESHRA